MDEQRIESTASIGEGETEDDSYIQALHSFKTNPVNLNTANDEELKELQILSEFQIESLITYRKLFGHFLSVYELQAIPAWDMQTIRRVRQYISVELITDISNDWKKWLKKGQHSFLLRYSKRIMKEIDAVNFKGSRFKVFYRYRYSSNPHLQFGLVAEKDDGEQFFKGAQRGGFDYYSMHLLLKKIGKIETIVLGDYTINMGQGLINWQSTGFRKGAETMAIKHQSPVLKIYNSSGEVNFYRGIGLSVRNRKGMVTFFLSRRMLSGSVDTDTIYNKEYVRSINTSGYHRTESEINGRKKLAQLTFGGCLSFKQGPLRWNLNAVNHHYSIPLQKRPEPYNLYTIKGNRWSNYSLDYSYTWKNLHGFGEVAIDKQMSPAILGGLLVSVGHTVDISLLYRGISRLYQAVWANAFIENSTVSNENGLYFGISFRPARGWQLTAYGDFFRFPWLKYRIDGPSNGQEYLIQVLYTPNKEVELNSRFRWNGKMINDNNDSTIISALYRQMTFNWRIQLNVKMSKAITFRNRAEIQKIRGNGQSMNGGFLIYSEILFRPPLSKKSGSIRIQYTETSGYESRIYAYESDVLFSNSIVPHWGKCFRYYLNISHELLKKFTFGIRWAHTLPIRNYTYQTIDLDEGSVGKSEIKIQLMLII